MKDGEKDLVAHLVDESRVERTAGSFTRPTYGKTRLMEEICAAIRLAAKPDFVVITGPAGSLKTTCALAMAQDIPGAIYACVQTAHASALGVVRTISAADHVATEEKNTAGYFDALVAKWRGSGRTLIIDEIHKLGAFRRDEGLHILRDLQDATGIGMAWLGMPTIARYIRDGHARGMESLDQLFSRVGLWLDLTEAAAEAGGGGGDPGGDGAAICGGGLVTVEDVRRMLAARKLRFTAEAVRYLVALGREEGAGAFRTLDKVLSFAETVARGGEVSETMVRGIQARRLGLRAAENLENRMSLRMQKVSVA